MPAFKDRAQDTSTTTGTGDFTLSGTAPSGKEDFNTAFGTGSRFAYTIQGQSGSEWETGEGYLSGATTLVRDRVTGSSNSDALVNFSSGTKDVFCDVPAEFFNTVDGAVLALRYAVS